MKEREAWVDNVKIFACMLVLLGHFFQSMVEASIITESVCYKWFITNIYIFHVPLFFICSGYLYQRGKAVDSYGAWWSNAKKKLLVLGVPYLTFSLITWGLKVLFSSVVNNEAESLFTTLFVHPISQYWYFYILIILFLIVPTLNSKYVTYSVVFAAFVLKIMNIMRVFGDMYLIKRISENMIWFVLGMLIYKFGSGKFKSYKIGISLVIAFFTAFGFLYEGEAVSKTEEFILALFACIGFILIFRSLDFVRSNVKVSQYTMPIFLMHTIFASFLRSVLLKIGITNWIVHFALGIPMSIFAPIVAYEIMKKNRFLLFFIEPRAALSKKK